MYQQQSKLFITYFLAGFVLIGCKSQSLSSQAAVSSSTTDSIAPPANTTQKKIEYDYSYRVRGKHYQVLADDESFQEVGPASWYGPGFHGKKTANGERYNMYALTAAHKTLPLGSRVQVTNLNNGKKIIVRINDRGPFHGGRIIDLSKKAADQLDMIKNGEVPVHIKSLSH